MNNNESYVENFNEICIVKIVIPFSLLLSEIKNEITHDRHRATEIYAQIWRQLNSSKYEMKLVFRSTDISK